LSDKTAYWFDLCDDDLITAKALLKSKRLLHMGFFCNMIVEKALKAVIVERTDEIPPKIHDLIKLAARAGIADELSSDQKHCLGNCCRFKLRRVTRNTEKRSETR
jgi:HEPN domain-containing protein